MFHHTNLGYPLTFKLNACNSSGRFENVLQRKLLTISDDEAVNLCRPTWFDEMINEWTNVQIDVCCRTGIIYCRDIALAMLTPPPRQTIGPTIKLFWNVTCLFGCCLMSVWMVALSSGRMLTVAGILICSISHTGSRDYNVRYPKSLILLL